MTGNMWFYAGMLLFGTFISAISQVMLKLAARKTYASRLKEYLNPLVIAAYAIFVVTTILSIVAYKGIPISMGPLLEATGYIYVTVFGVTIFHEKLTVRRVIALLVIIGGIVIYSV